MRLWHYKLIKYLPNSQLVAQWRELNSIYKSENNHILINYVYDYEKAYLLSYSILVIDEMNNRNMNINKWDNFEDYFCKTYEANCTNLRDLHYKEHDDDYLVMNFYNLKEKYVRGQKDFDENAYDKLIEYMKKTSIKEV